MPHSILIDLMPAPLLLWQLAIGNCCRENSGNSVYIKTALIVEKNTQVGFVAESRYFKTEQAARLLVGQKRARC
jgi:hypothetical protein